MLLCMLQCTVSVHRLESVCTTKYNNVTERVYRLTMAHRSNPARAHATLALQVAYDGMSLMTIEGTARAALGPTGRCSQVLEDEGLKFTKWWWGGEGGAAEVDETGPAAVGEVDEGD